MRGSRSGPAPTNTNLGTVTALLNKVVACNTAKQFCSSATGTCAAGSGTIRQTYASPIYNIAKNRNPQTTASARATCA